MKHIFYSVLTLSVVLTGQVVTAEQFVCAAVYPCDSDGNLEEQYLGSDCEDFYRSQCILTQLNQCQNNLESKSAYAEEILAKYNKLKRKIGKQRARKAKK